MNVVTFASFHSYQFIFYVIRFIVVTPSLSPSILKTYFTQILSTLVISPSSPDSLCGFYPVIQRLHLFTCGSLSWLSHLFTTC